MDMIYENTNVFIIFYYRIIRGLKDMANINLEVRGYVEDVVESMIKKGYVKTRTEAVRLALFEFDREHKLSEERIYELAAAKSVEAIKSGKEKVRKFSLNELD